ncbi:U32 family peptidase [Leptothoe kymatousa]|uniref:U32 family peptidase n=1 Tax=Leptothoe kymatousa TAU-MAC 1615 TaxID=2364775 RepID=A0ABS5Y272_9CYAN|nr:U32 family peptidase [Leptothoe kymatousa]MBT9311474.1 U32 family peptidase [Leptothoe kymatousa TAU-MAC 1615]
MTTGHCPELLAPAGTWDCAKAAVENGADAIYFGLDRFNARMRSQNFTEADLPELMAFLHSRGVKGYVTFNTLIFPQELAAAERYLRTMMAAGVDAAIVQDVGMCRLIRHLSADFPIHGSTQMTVTSAAGVEFAHSLGAQLVVLARECSLKDIEKIQQQTKDIALPLEVFVHGALCVAYSGQCLTSEALGGRSANRGECAQACRMTYDMKVDGELIDLGDKQYLLSPQDLSGLPVLPDLIKSGVSCLKIEGRLKAPEYVANVTRVYRQALDRAWQENGTNSAIKSGTNSAMKSGTKNGTNSATTPTPTEKLALKLGNRPISYEPTADERYNLEMAFSRGLYTGWFRGINNQELVHARFAKKRGVYLGDVERVTKHQVELKTTIPVKAGDGIVFDSGHPDTDQGGRIYGVEQRGRNICLSFGKHSMNLRRVQPGQKVWKTSDPELEKTLRQSYRVEQPAVQQPIDIEVHGVAGEPVVAIATDPQGHIAQAASEKVLETARNKPLTTEKLQQQLARLGNTPFKLGQFTNQLADGLIVPVSELNRLRRQLVEQLLEQRQQPKVWAMAVERSHRDLLPDPAETPSNPATLVPLVRNGDQLRTVLQCGLTTVYCELENPVHYRAAVALTRELNPRAKLYVAPPRITKPGEQYILKQVRQSNADGYLVRNYDHLQFFADQPCIGDFSLNVANPITAAYFKTEFGLEKLTASYDLNVAQLMDLLTSAPANWFDITIHQHMPMFHMEHCVFCAFLSEGTDFTNCGRPCENHDVVLRDRTGTDHVLQADAGCRNTLYNGVAQTGAEFIPRLMDQGARRFRIDFLNESPTQVQQILTCYQQLLNGDMTGHQLWRTLKLSSQLGVTRGTLERH